MKGQSKLESCERDDGEGFMAYEVVGGGSKPWETLGRLGGVLCILCWYVKRGGEAISD